MKKVLRWWPLLLLIVAGVAGYMVWKQQGQTAVADDDSLSTVYTVSRGNLTASISPTGEVYAAREASLSFDVSKVELTALKIVPGQVVKAGEVLAQIETTALENAVLQAEANLTVAQDSLDEIRTPYTELDLLAAKLAVQQAETSLQEAKDSLAETKAGPTAASLATAQATVATAQAKYADLVAQPTAATIAAAKQSLDSAKNSLWASQSSRDSTCGRAQDSSCNGAQASVLNAEIKVQQAQQAYEDAQKKASAADIASAAAQTKKAQEDLATLQKSPTATSIMKAETAVAQAEYNLAKAKKTLADVEAGANPKDVQVAEAKVVSAQAALTDAQTALKAATLVAPFDGTIVTVGVEVGDVVSSNVVVATLADLTGLKIKASIDETDIANVQIGQDVQITFDAFPGRSFTGKVLEVPLQGTLSSSVLTYQVPISLQGAEDIVLKTGMTANLKIVVGKREKVLLVPALAVEEGETGQVVLVQDGVTGSTLETPVQIGLGDGTYVEVLRGLIEGDNVVVSYSTTTTTNSNQQFRDGGIPGGMIMSGGAVGGPRP